jgi:glutaconate CoA-transferase subunit B
MVVTAAREIRDEDVVFVGMRLPLIAFAYAKRTHAASSRAASCAISRRRSPC